MYDVYFIRAPFRCQINYKLKGCEWWIFIDIRFDVIHVSFIYTIFNTISLSESDIFLLLSMYICMHVHVSIHDDGYPTIYNNLKYQSDRFTVSVGMWRQKMKKKKTNKQTWLAFNFTFTHTQTCSTCVWTKPIF